MSDINTKEVFISYSTKDVDDANYLCRLLEDAGVSCWIAPRDIPAGGEWAGCIVAGIEACYLVAYGGKHLRHDLVTTSVAHQTLP